MDAVTSSCGLSRHAEPEDLFGKFSLDPEALAGTTGLL